MDCIREMPGHREVGLSIALQGSRRLSKGIRNWKFMAIFEKRQIMSSRRVLSVFLRELGVLCGKGSFSPILRKGKAKNYRNVRIENRPIDIRFDL
jgi:hypothetical protein